MDRSYIHLEVSRCILAEKWRSKKHPKVHAQTFLSKVQSHLLLCVLGMTASNFSWEKYLKDTNAVAAPEHLFKEVNLTYVWILLSTIVQQMVVNLQLSE